VLLPAYAAANWMAFGSLLPTSAAAKQLVRHFGINTSYLHIVAGYTPYGRLAGITLVLGVVALVVVLLRRRQGHPPAVPPAALLAGAVAFAFAAVLFAINTLSGWMYFGWYAYPFPPALVAAFTFIGHALAPRLGPALRERATRFVVAAACVAATAGGVDYFACHGPLWSVADNGLLGMSFDLAARMRSRPGLAGMGAIGGFASYVMDRPVVQLEGLVADRAMVEHVRREDPLGAVLQTYGVDYLVVTLYTAKKRKVDGCYVITQPNAEWAGDRVAKMHGSLCAEPVEHFVTTAPRHRWSSFSTLETYVFDVRGARWREAPSGPPRPDQEVDVVAVEEGQVGNQHAE
jgi:hypothetical protein